MLTLHFDDIELDHEFSISGQIYRDLVLFDDEMGQKVVDFVKGLKPNDTFIAHCHAGISRSGAVVTFARELHSAHVDYNKFWEDNRIISPNMHVLKTLRKIGFGNPYLILPKGTDDDDRVDS